MGAVKITQTTIFTAPLDCNAIAWRGLETTRASLRMILQAEKYRGCNVHIKYTNLSLNSHC